MSPIQRSTEISVRHTTCSSEKGGVPFELRVTRTQTVEDLNVRTLGTQGAGRDLLGTDPP